MPLDQIAAILRESPLDVETKLCIIDLIAMSDDEAFVKDIADLVLEWKKSDTEIRDALLAALTRVEEEYEAGVNALNQQAHRAQLQVAEEIFRKEKYQKIREKLSKHV